MKLRFDEARAHRLFATLQDLWTRKEGVFKGIVLPQDRWSLPSDPVRKANRLLFTAITQRGGIVSEDPFKYLEALETEHPDLFDPLLVIEKWTIPQIEAALKRVVIERRWKSSGNGHAKSEQLYFFEPESNGNGAKGLYKLDEFATSWWRNARTLAERWDGNVLNIYEGVVDFEEFFARADHKRNELGLHGMRRKILSLFTIWLQEHSLVPLFPTPVPVDFHAMRLLFVTGVVIPEDVAPFIVREGVHPPRFAGRMFVRVTEELMDEIAIWSQGFIAQHGFSHLMINPALWTLSRELCLNELQSKSRGRGADTSLNYSEDPKTNPGLWPMPYPDPSRVCPLAPMCSKIVPWAPYYDFGILALDERVPYPHPLLPGSVKPRGEFARRRNTRD